MTIFQKLRKKKLVPPTILIIKEDEKFYTKIHYSK